MRPSPVMSVPSATTKGSRSSADDGSSRPESCSAPSRSAGCTLEGGCRAIFTIGEDALERPEGRAVFQPDCAKAIVEEGWVDGTRAHLTRRHRLRAGGGHAHGRGVAGRVRHLLLVIAHAADLKAITTRANLDRDDNVFRVEQDKWHQKVGTLERGALRARIHRDGGGARHLEVTGARKDDAPPDNMVSDKGHERPGRRRGESVLFDAASNHSRLNERVSHLAPPERLTGVRERGSLVWHVGSDAWLRLEKAVHDGAAVAEGADATDKRFVANGRCPLGGAVPLAIPIATRSRPVAPAAGSACPTLALIESSASGAEASLAHRTTDASERTSIGSPRPVPVPCASVQATPSAVVAASARAARSSSICADPLGAVSEADLPSWRTQLPSSDSDTAPSTSLVRSATEQHASARQ
eukprot:scaffold36275_cov154-Isochrysis_galbana.AAC.25